MKKIWIFLILFAFLIYSGCQMMTENAIQGKWKMVALFGIYKSSLNVLTYDFDDGFVYFENTDDNRKEIFTYSMSSNTIKISGAETTNSGLVDGSYKVYQSCNTMIWYYVSTNAETYKFEKL